MSWQYEELCESLASMLESQTNDSVALLQQVEQLKSVSNHEHNNNISPTKPICGQDYHDCISFLQSVLSQGSQLTQMSSQISELELACDRRQSKLAQVEESLLQERSKVQQLEGELATIDIVKEGLGKELDKVIMGADH